MAHNLIVNYGLYRDLEVFVRGGLGEEMGRAGVVAVCCAQVAGESGLMAFLVVACIGRLGCRELSRSSCLYK
jgi:hypothetical protein